MCEVSCETWETLGNLPDKQTDQSVETLWTFRYHHSLSLIFVCTFSYIKPFLQAVLFCIADTRRDNIILQRICNELQNGFTEEKGLGTISDQKKKYPKKTVNHRTYDSQLLTYGITFSDSCLKPSDCHFRWILKYLLNSCIFIRW